MPVRLSYTERAAFCKNPLAKKLFFLLSEKQTNLALSADVTKSAELLALAEMIGPEICILKTHIDILKDFSPQLIKELTAIAEKHQFLIFEDRKFADIGNTVKLQYEGGVYHIADWAHIVNAHTIPGPGIISGLAEVGLKKERGLLLLAEMSSKDHLFDESYIKKTVSMAEQFPDFVIGFISQNKLSSNASWIYMTPGIQMKEGRDALGQQYNTPQSAIIKNETDIIIVGRGIITAEDPLQEAKNYRTAGWQAYQYSINSLNLS